MLVRLLLLLLLRLVEAVLFFLRLLGAVVNRRRRNSLINSCRLIWFCRVEINMVALDYDLIVRGLVVVARVAELAIDGHLSRCKTTPLARYSMLIVVFV